MPSTIFWYKASQTIR
uniref:Uncharacterized protein n=1 Tax=Arundo donax TaxID=35708 RepID=A0A0A9EU20_ARUDO